MSEPSLVDTGIVGGAPEADAAATAAATGDKPRGLWSDAGYDLRRRPMFWLSLALVVLVVLIAAFPQLFTSVDPNAADLKRSNEGPSGTAWFGYDLQGRDVYARTIYGARASVVVGVFAVAFATLVGGMVGILAGFFGGWIDSLFSRIGDVFYGLPFVLGAIILLFTFVGSAVNPSQVKIIFLVILAIVLLTWPGYARIIRATILSAKHADYVVAARALGARPGRIIFRHLLPNCVAPLIVLATINVGAYIAAEATLSFLGVGLRSPVISWGVMISDMEQYFRVAPHAVLFPAIFLSVTVLSFVMLGDAVRQALDPKLR
jgi:oligopeptide transport system permease protein